MGLAGHRPVALHLKQGPRLSNKWGPPQVPKFVFAATLEEQEKQLQEHALVKRFAESRKENLKNPYHPRYHFVSPEDGLMNDPTGLSFWQGRVSATFFL